MQSDTNLMLDFAGGDISAFEQIMIKYKKLVMNVAFRYVQDKGLAEDITQDVFMKIYNSADSYKPKAALSTWIYRITVNHSLNKLRKIKKIKTISLASIGEISDSDKNFFPAENMENSELTNFIRNAVASLPHRQQTAVILKKYEKLSYDEIAKIMNCTIPAVDSLLQRAKENLKIKISPIVPAK